MDVKVSVILPSLNVGPYIEECLKSVCNQTLRDIEILCIDAFSTDTTRQVIKKYQKEDERIQLIDSERKSYGFQMNLGIEKAKGKYIGIVETDDYICPDMYASLFDIAENKQCDYVKADFDFVNDSNGYIEFTRDRLFPDNSDIYGTVLDPSKNEYIYLHDHNIWKGVYLKKFLLDNCIRFNESLGAAYQDIGFAMQVFSSARSAYYSDKSFYRYRIGRADSSVKSPKTLMFIWQELQFLMNRSNWPNQFNVCAVFSRFALAFTDELRRILVNCGISIEDKNIRPYFDLICSKYKEFMQQGIWPNDDTNPGTKETMLLVLQDIDAFIKNEQIAYTKQQAIFAEQKTKREQFYSSVDSLKVKNIIIFGAGAYGRSCYRDLYAKNISVAAFLDNNEKLKGTLLHGIQVIVPADLALFQKEIGDTGFIIANKSHAEELSEQLIKMGIPENKICRYR